jgi:ERCC4-type nuclease
MLIVDYRERHLERLFEDACEEIRFTQLPIGDYLVVSGSEAVVVERKTVRDFLSSVRSNRLWDQLLRMLKADRVLEYDVSKRVLLIHGNFLGHFELPFIDHRESLKSWAQLMGAYLEITYVYNTPIIHAESDAAFKSFMRILVKRESSGKNDKLPGARWYRKPARASLPIKDRKKYILSALPNIGDSLAGNLLEYFGTISGIAFASVEELQKVHRIGEKKAQLIYESFH